MSDNPEKIGTRKESKWMRALYALPLLGILFGCSQTMGVSLAMLEATLSEGGTKVALGNGVVTAFTPIFTGLSSVDSTLSLYAAFFTPCIGNFDPLGRLQAIAFLADLVPLQVIWMVEGVRRGNSGTVAGSVRTIMSMFYQFQGIGFLAPIYYFINYIQTTLLTISSPGSRQTDLKAVKTIIPTIAIAYIIPSVLMFTVPGLTNRQWINGLFFQPFPIYAFVVQRLLCSLINETQEEANDSEVDIPYLRIAYASSAIASATVYLCLWVLSPLPMVDIFFKNVGNPSAAMPFLTGAAKVLRYDYLSSFGAGAVWILLSFWDLKRGGILGAHWGKIVGVFAGTTFVFGPGAGMAVMWAWREEVLAEKGREKDKKRAA